MINVFAESSEGIKLVVVYLTTSKNIKFVSESSDELKAFLAISTTGIISVCRDDPDLSQSLRCLCGLSEFIDFSLQTKQLGSFKSIELISNCEVKIIFSIYEYQKQKSYEINMENEDICEEYVIAKLRQSSKIACKNCQRKIVDLQLKRKNLQFQMMPKDDWKELIDCWSCHNDEFGYYASILPSYRENSIYVGMDYVIFGKGLLEDSCEHIAAEVSVPVSEMLFCNGDACEMIDPVHLMILRLIYWCRSQSSFRFSLQLNDCNIMIWVLTSVSKISLDKQFVFHNALKLLWKKVPLDEKIDIYEYEPLQGIREAEGQFIVKRLEQNNASLPLSIQISLDGFRTSFLYLE